MNKTLLTGAVAALLAGPAMAQTASLDDIQKEIAEMKARNERLEAEVEYLKESAKADRKDTAQKAVVLETLNTTASKYVWSGDFRYRSEHITTATSTAVDEQTRHRDRIRARFGVTVKVNDTITGRLQLATSNDPRSTNQTLGEDWTRKPINVDLAYVDWKPISSLSVQLGKTPIPWTKTASYYFDNDLSPEGAAVKFVSGNLFATAAVEWLNERHSGAPAGARSDSKLLVGQVGLRQPIGTSTLTAAVGYFDVTAVKDEVVSPTALPGTPASTCTANATFFGGSAYGNNTYDNNGAAASGCSALLSDFTDLNALVQFDFLLGNFPLSVFADYMQNQDAEIYSGTGTKLDTAFSAGITFNRANAGVAKTWDVGVVYQRSEADSVFAQFHDSDFGDGRTDSEGYTVKANFVAAPNWTIAATYFINTLNNDTGSATTKDLDYDRLQLDLNFRF